MALNRVVYVMGEWVVCQLPNISISNGARGLLCLLSLQVTNPYHSIWEDSTIQG